MPVFAILPLGIPEFLTMLICLLPFIAIGIGVFFLVRYLRRNSR